MSSRDGNGDTSSTGGRAREVPSHVGFGDSLLSSVPDKTRSIEGRRTNTFSSSVWDR